MTIDYRTLSMELIRTIREIMPVNPDFTKVDLSKCDSVLRIVIPDDYSALMSESALLEFDHFALFDLVDHPYKRWNLCTILTYLYNKHQSVLKEFFPIAELQAETLVVIDQIDQSIRVLDLTQSIDRIQRPQIAHSFYEYVYKSLLLVLQRLHHIHESWKKLERRVHAFSQEFQYSHSKGGKLPRNHDWRPYRYCIQDVFFGLSVVRHNREHNYLEIDVCLTAFVPGYDQLAGAEALMVFFLTEAFKCGGSMELKFTEHVENGTVPRDIVSLAARHQVRLSSVDRGVMTADEATLIYMRLSRFRATLENRLWELHNMRLISIPRVCFAVHHGLWSADQIEMFVAGSSHPEAILAGSAQVQHRHAYVYALHHARAALLAETFERALLYRQHVDENNVSHDREDDMYRADTLFDGDTYMKVFQTSDFLSLPWAINANEKLKVWRFQVLIRARDASDIKRFLLHDIALASHITRQMRIDTFVLIPRDYYDLNDAFRDAIQVELQSRGVVLLVAPDHSNTFDQEAMKRMARSRLVRK